MPIASPVAAMVQGLREMNYYPSTDAWGGMWFDWRPAMIDADMARIAALGANTVRVIIQPASFGYPTPSPQYMSELSQMVSIAASHGLRVHFTLFDLMYPYTDLTGSLQWAAAILAPYYRDPRVAFIELQNDIDPTNPAAMAWARAMLPAISVDSGLPVTVSVTAWNSASTLALLISGLGASQPDFYDDHFYGTPDMAPSVFRSAQTLAAGRPLFIGETGESTDPSNLPSPASDLTETAYEQTQAYYYYSIEADARNAGLPPAAPWILYDFAPSPTIDPKEQHFGLYRLDGTAKPAAAVVRAAFTQ